jgi:hypothetical protein
MIDLYSSRRKKFESWIVRFVKFNIIGFVVFLIGTVIYSAFFNVFGFWTWMLANAAGSILQFSLINYFNGKKRGRIFETFEPKTQPS